MPDKQTALIGIGNMFRRDDGVGIAIVRNLKRCLSAFDQNGLEIFECSGEGTELMECWQGFQRVIIFDAVMANGEPGKIYRLQADRQFIPSDFFKYSSHAFSLAEAIELARVLDRLPDNLIIYGVEGKDFSHGEEPGAPLKQAIQTVTDQVLAEL